MSRRWVIRFTTVEAVLFVIGWFIGSALYGFVKAWVAS